MLAALWLYAPIVINDYLCSLSKVTAMIFKFYWQCAIWGKTRWITPRNSSMRLFVGTPACIQCKDLLIWQSYCSFNIWVQEPGETFEKQMKSVETNSMFPVIAISKANLTWEKAPFRESEEQCNSVVWWHRDQGGTTPRGMMAYGQGPHSIEMIKICWCCCYFMTFNYGNSKKKYNFSIEIFILLF